MQLDLIEQVKHDLGQGGTLARSLPNYEERPSQIEMAHIIAKALLNGETVLADAPTGTGKSHAYLIPSVRSGKTVIISTANKALQEQLYFKDIPFLQEHLCPFTATYIKGIGNYLCLDRFQEVEQFQIHAPDPQFPQLLDALRNPGFEGDLERLPFALNQDLHRRICGDSDLCTWGKCDFYRSCYVRMAKDASNESQIIIVNHTLLLLDILAEGKLLPERDAIIIDEAHNLIEEATNVFTIKFMHSHIGALLSSHFIRTHTDKKHQDAAGDLAWRVWEVLDKRFEKVEEGKKITLREPVEDGLKLASALQTLHDDLVKNQPLAFHSEKEEILYRKSVERSQELANAVRVGFAVNNADIVYYMERKPSLKKAVFFPIEVSAAPLDVAPTLEEKLFREWPTVLTSATLASTGSSSMAPSFEFFRQQVGLQAAARVNHQLILPPTFDYASCAQLYVPRPADMPEPVYARPNEPKSDLVVKYEQAMIYQMEQLVRCSQGHAFLLFSSRRMLRTVYEVLVDHLPYNILRQGDLPRAELLKQFREQNSVLFALRSFWEGVDIAGDALTLVVIDKLPFDPPDDPVHAARVEKMKRLGQDWFGGYVLPSATLRLKQGAGRLIRGHDDYGVIAILDSRLHTKKYRLQVINALPPATKVAQLRLVETFYAGRRNYAD